METLIENAFQVNIKYLLEFEDKNTKEFETNLDLTSTEVKYYTSEEFSWTKLDFHKCAHCTLSSEKFKHCPAAVSIADIIEYFSKHPDYQEAKCTVIYPEKIVVVEKPVSDILSCLMGLRLATSLCPLLSELKMMARFHEPFASPFYTVYRATSMYLLKEYFISQDSKKNDFSFKGLKELYNKLSISNLRMQERLKGFPGHKCQPCSMNLLSVLTVTMTLLLDEHLSVLKELSQCR